jgi:hypothetical protein
LLRRLLPFTTVLTVLAALYAGWTLYSRRDRAAETERQSKEQRTEADQKLVAAFGGDRLTILGFNSADREIAAGGRAVLCYGVSNAVQVKIEPGVEPIKPSVSHCLEVFPKKTTTYTFSAEDAKGNRKTASLTINVR